LSALRRYLLLVLTGNFVWEILQLPGFADWQEGSWSWLAFIVTAGDILIATTSLVLGLIVFGDEQWPAARGSYWRVATAASAFGFVYTTYSEWRHAVVLRHWTYSALMPVVPGLGVGLLPLLQWILIPAAAFYCTHTCVPDAARGLPDDSRPAPLPSRDRATTGSRNPSVTDSRPEKSS
jgi:hypothetical protein